MGSADQQLKDGCDTNSVSLYYMVCTGQIGLCFLGETTQATNSPYISHCISLPLKAFTPATGITVGEKQRQGKSLPQS